MRAYLAPFSEHRMQYLFPGAMFVPDSDAGQRYVHPPQP